MVIDSSALVAILLHEEDAESIGQKMATEERRLISSFAALETAIVIESKKGDHGCRELELLLYRIEADIVPFDSAQFQIARKAWRTFGKGRHPAGLNIGDCCTYALARYTGEPLVCTGDDFSKTDIEIMN